MDKPIIAVIQHKILVTKTLDELYIYFHRFLRIAKTKGSKLAVFPEFSGLAVGIPLFPGWRNALLKEAATPKQGLLPKLKGMLAGSAANVVRADLKKSLEATLQEMPESLYDASLNLYSDLARQYDMTIVAGSLYYYDAETASIRNASLVFGPDGSLLGEQSQVVPDPETLDIIQPAQGWTPIDSPVGKIGILFGYEALYPEPARVLAYQGADMLLTVAATKLPATYQKIRQAALARCQENQLYGAVAFLVGEDPLATPEEPPFLGRSAIFAPLEFTPRFTGVMTELGSAQAEGVITAEWDYPALHELWETSETPIRKQMPLGQVGVLAQIYSGTLTLEASSGLLTVQPDEEEEPVSDMEALPVGEKEPKAEPEELLPEDHADIPIFAPILPTEPPIIPLGEPEDTLSDADDEARESGGNDFETSKTSTPELESSVNEQKETPDQESQAPEAGDATTDSQG